MESPQCTVYSDGLHYLMGVVLVMLCASAGNVSTVFKERESHNEKRYVLRCTARREASQRVSKTPVQQGKKTRTLVVNGVPKSEDGQHGDNDRRRRGVLAVEEATLDAARGRLGRGALWELGVERDEGAQVGALPRRLCSQRKYWSGKW